MSKKHGYPWMSRNHEFVFGECELNLCLSFFMWILRSIRKSIKIQYSSDVSTHHLYIIYIMLLFYSHRETIARNFCMILQYSIHNLMKVNRWNHLTPYSKVKLFLYKPIFQDQNHKKISSKNLFQKTSRSLMYIQLITLVSHVNRNAIISNFLASVRFSIKNSHWYDDRCSGVIEMLCSLLETNRCTVQFIIPWNVLNETLYTLMMGN